MPRNARNHGEILFGKIQLENRKYRASELADLLGRAKRRILSLSEELDLGRKIQPFGSGCPVRELAKQDVETLMKWFDNNGRRHWEAPWTKNRKQVRRSKKQAV